MVHILRLSVASLLLVGLGIHCSDGLLRKETDTTPDMAVSSKDILDIGQVYPSKDDTPSIDDFEQAEGTELPDGSILITPRPVGAPDLIIEAMNNVFEVGQEWGTIPNYEPCTRRAACRSMCCLGEGIEAMCRPKRECGM